MRKIEHDMCAAIRSRTEYECDNTKVIQRDHGYAEIRLHGELIAFLNYQNGIMQIKDAGYRTPTTKSRLNALLDMFTSTGGGKGIRQSGGVWVWKDGELWPGTAQVRLLI